MKSKATTNESRREFLKAGALAGAALAGCATTGRKRDPGQLRITVAGYDYDRVQPLIDGRAPVQGCDVTFESAAIGEMNTHVFSGSATTR